MNAANLNPDKLMDTLKGYAGNAKEYITDGTKFDELVKKVEDKVQNVPGIGEQLADLTLVISMTRAYIAKQYRDVEEKTIALEIGALLYFISPIDLIPDRIKGIGHLDDIAVLLLAQKLAHDDIEKYRNWLENKNTERMVEEAAGAVDAEIIDAADAAEETVDATIVDVEQ